MVGFVFNIKEQQLDSTTTLFSCSQTKKKKRKKM